MEIQKEKSYDFEWTDTNTSEQIPASQRHRAEITACTERDRQGRGTEAFRLKQQKSILDSIEHGRCVRLEWVGKGRDNQWLWTSTDLFFLSIIYKCIHILSLPRMNGCRNTLVIFSTMNITRWYTCLSAEHAYWAGGQMWVSWMWWIRICLAATLLWR